MCASSHYRGFVFRDVIGALNSILSINLIVGIFWTTYAVVLVDLLGVDVIERALGQSLAFAAIGYIAGVPLAGEAQIGQKGYMIIDLVIVINYRLVLICDHQNYCCTHGLR